MTRGSPTTASPSASASPSRRAWRACARCARAACCTASTPRSTSPRWAGRCRRSSPCAWRSTTASRSTSSPATSAACPACSSCSTSPARPTTWSGSPRPRRQDLREFVVDHLATDPAVAHAETSLIYEHSRGPGSGAGSTGLAPPASAQSSSVRSARAEVLLERSSEHRLVRRDRREQCQRGPQLQVVRVAEAISRARRRWAPSRSAPRAAATEQRVRRVGGGLQPAPEGRSARRSDSFPARAAAGTRTTSNAVRLLPLLSSATTSA